MRQLKRTSKNSKSYIVGMIPAKIGSKRLAMKNLALINGKPLIYYAIKAAKESQVFDRIVINAEDMFFSEIAKRYHVNFYKRPDKIVKTNTKTDTVVYDFLKKNPCDIVAWVSPIAPMQSPAEVADIVNYFIEKDLDSLMTVKNEQVHCVYKGKPVNFNQREIFAQTQDIVPVQPFVYSLMMWRAKTFMHTFKKRGYALLCGKVGFYPVSKFSSVIIKNKTDLMIADYIMRAISRKRNYDVRYDARLRRGKYEL